MCVSVCVHVRMWVCVRVPVVLGQRMCHNGPNCLCKATKLTDRGSSCLQGAVSMVDTNRQVRVLTRCPNLPPAAPCPFPVLFYSRRPKAS